MAPFLARSKTALGHAGNEEENVGAYGELAEALLSYSGESEDLFIQLPNENRDSLVFRYAPDSDLVVCYRGVEVASPRADASFARAQQQELARAAHTLFRGVVGALARIRFPSRTPFPFELRRHTFLENGIRRMIAEDGDLKQVKARQKQALGNMNEKTKESLVLSGMILRFMLPEANLKGTFKDAVLHPQTPFQRAMSAARDRIQENPQDAAAWEAFKLANLCQETLETAMKREVNLDANDFHAALETKELQTV